MQMISQKWRLAALMVGLVTLPAFADGDDKAQKNESETIGIDVEIEGVTIINDKVYIDGVLIPKGRREVVSLKTGKVYRIDWGRDGNVAVTEK